MNTRFIKTVLRLSWTLLFGFGVSACTGGSGSGGNVTLATSEQSVDPVVLEIPVAYIVRPIPESATDLRQPLAFTAGARLIIRERASATADDLDVTEQIASIVADEEAVSADTLAIDIRGLESSFDGNTLIFAARVVVEPVDANLDQTTWNLWTFDFTTGQAQYLIPSRIKRNEGVENGGGQDLAPHFLSDDRIVFSSTRQVASQARQLNEGRGQIFAAMTEGGNEPAAVLHIYDPQLRDSEFKQISFNRGHDLDPTVLSTGEIIFSRWNNGTGDHISLFRINPAGDGLSPLYGFHSQNSGTEGASVEYTQARELDDGRLVSLVKSFSSESFGGEIVLIDSEAYSDIAQSIQTSQTGTTQQALTDTEVRTDGLLSRGGQYGSVYPLRDGSQRLLVTWSDCRIIDEDATLPTQSDPSPGDILPCKLQPDNTNQATPLYGGWVYDPTADTQRPVVLGTAGFMVTEFIAAEPRDFPDLVPAAENFDVNMALENTGRLLIDSVYDLDGIDISPDGISRHREPGTPPYANRPARFLRIIQPVPIPDPNLLEIPHYAFGVSSAFSFREIAGYVPVEPDGSATVVVSANRPFSFSVLDANGRRIGSDHNYWLQIAPGETLHCAGCHSDANTLPHGRSDALLQSSNPGAVALTSGTTGFPATNAQDLFALERGKSMAQTWNFHRPLGNANAVDRALLLEPAYTDEWSAVDLQADAEILDRGYDPAWTDIAIDKPLVVDNLDPTQASRIVINYIDHIHPIWERLRTPIDNGEGILFDACIGCHSTQGDTVVPAGQMDLSALPSDVNSDHYRSYRELLSTDQEQWITLGDVLADRQRICTSVDENGDAVFTTMTLSVSAVMRAGSANGSSAFFNCFSGGSCGLDIQPPLPSNCTEDDGTAVPATANTVDHNGLLSASELRLLSEWLDIGAQYYNNPFDPRLSD